jgi:hypothetical protein
MSSLINITRRIVKKKLVKTVKPSFIVIGAQKAGTTALYSFLSRHPQLRSSSYKETDFFYSDKFYQKGLNYYHQYYRFSLLSRDNFITYEASPSYLSDHRNVVAKRIYQYNPKIKLICILRDPVYRAYSAWNMYNKFTDADRDFFFKWHSDRNYIDPSNYVRRKREELNDFNLFISNELDVISNDKMIELPTLFHGMYYKNLQQFISYFGIQQILILENSELNIDTQSCLYRICEYLEIDHIEWSKFIEKGERILKGKYRKEIDNESVEILSDYYKQSNEHLYRLVNQKYNWL